MSLPKLRFLVLAIVLVPVTRGIAPANASGPEAVMVDVAFECVESVITDVEPRLPPEKGQSPWAMGVVVRFAHGQQLVDYETPKVVEAEKPGDRVQVCLVRVPTNCPPGDDRGSEYRVFDHARKVAYFMGANLHMCGGA